MTANDDARLAPCQRLSRGLKYTAVGPVDITRGVVGLSANAVACTASELHRRYEIGQLRRQLAAAAEAVAALPETVAVLPAAMHDPKPTTCRRRPLLIAAVAVTTLAAGAVAFTVIRRSMRPEPSPLPPSVDVTPRP